MHNCTSCGANQFTNNQCDYCGTNKTIIVPPTVKLKKKKIKADMSNFDVLEDKILIGDMNTIETAIRCTIKGDMNTIFNATDCTVIGDMNTIKNRN